METTLNEFSTATLATGSSSKSGKAFWVLWGIELWERFGYYGVQAIIALYFVKQLGYTEAQSFYVFGSFSAFVYGFSWIGGWIGDKYLGSKETLILGVIVLALSYSGLALSTHQTIFYALAGIVVGNSLYKANSSSLVSKLYAKGDTRLDGAMTTPPAGTEHLNTIASMSLYSYAFLKVGIATACTALIMWMKRPLLNRFIAY